MLFLEVIHPGMRGKSAKERNDVNRDPRHLLVEEGGAGNEKYVTNALISALLIMVLVIRRK